MTTESASEIPGRAELDAAFERLSGSAHRTPVTTSTYFNERTGAELYFKCENFQRVGAFKFRGAFNAVSSLTEDELARGVVTHSSGNHAQALALSARLLGSRATIVMPRTAPAVKRAAVEGYGADVRLCEPSLAAREAGVEAVIEETGAVLVHPYNDRRIIAGQSTAARELFEDVPGLDAVLAPLGGGGLVSGTALAAAFFSPSTRVYGVEPSAADDALRSLQSGRIEPSMAPKTIADGLLSSLGELTFAIIRRWVEDVVTVDDSAIVRAMRLVFERMKMVVEPSAAVPLAALLEGKPDLAGKRVGIIVSGGNVDLDRLPWMAEEKP